jgi:hypothetical protein
MASIVMQELPRAKASMSVHGTKRTLSFVQLRSAFDPRQTFDAAVIDARSGDPRRVTLAAVST